MSTAKRRTSPTRLNAKRVGARRAARVRKAGSRTPPDMSDREFDRLVAERIKAARAWVLRTFAAPVRAVRA